LCGRVVAFFAFNGVARPLIGRILHNSVRGTERATVLSIQSSPLQLAGALTGVTMGRIADRLSIGVAFAIAAAIVAVGASACISMPPLTALSIAQADENTP
jgi:hypothetical protein